MRVFDVFPMNDELDLLALRLGQLDSVVDHFVLIESRRTYMGEAKPLYYQENKHLFEKWNHKISYKEAAPSGLGSWEYERYFREELVPLIYSLNPDPQDILSFSDLDEIPNPEVVKNYTPSLGLRNLNQWTFYYHFNNMMAYSGRSWSRARIGIIGHIQERGGIVDFRGGPGDMDPSWPSIENGGWHCSYFSDNLERLRRKVYAISHDDLHGYIRERSDKQILDDILGGKDLYHRSGIGDGQQWPTDDQRLPSYFLQNQDRFKMFTKEHFVEKYKDLSR
jgi:beta-1,4-mannosyl-glycoprotein beta-1,4-N-acetylglucosaminyltransferase